ncbi:MAG: hypothetical protein ACKOTF_05715 [Opitutaceae bacterium]
MAATGTAKMGSSGGAGRDDRAASGRRKSNSPMVALRIFTVALITAGLYLAFTSKPKQEAA